MSTFAVFAFISLAGIVVANSLKDPAYLLFVIFILVFWAVAFPPAINGNDDNTAYLVFAREFYGSTDASLQVLSERRMFNLGAGYVFQAPVVQWLGYRALALSEPLLGLLMSFAVLAAFMADRTAKYVAAAIIGCAPAMASHLLGNTAPVFMMSAALLLVLFAFAHAALNGPSVACVGMIWVGAAYICQFRPTMAVFLGLILMANLLMIRDMKTLRINGAWALGALLVFLASAVPYWSVYHTFLYPVLGRGIHVSSTGLTVNTGIPFAEFLGNLAVFVIKDRFFMPLSVLVALAINFDRKNIRLYLTLYGAFAVSAAAIVFSTGGVADSRYTMPVSIPLCMLLCAAALPPLGEGAAKWVRVPHAAGVLVLAASATGLVLLALKFSPQVSEIRYRMYTPDADQRDMLARIVSYAARHPDQKILFLATGMEKDATPGLSGRYLIMDAPGMIDPSRSLGLDYPSWLARVMAAEKVGLIVSSAFSCGAPAPEAKGWVGVGNFLVWKNSEALCSLRGSYDTKTVGPYLMMWRRDVGP